MLLFSKRASWLGIKLLPHPLSEDSEDIVPLYCCIQCFRKKSRGKLTPPPPLTPHIDDWTFFWAIEFQLYFWGVMTNKICPLLVDLSQLVWELLALSVCAFKYLFQNHFPYLTSLGNMCLLFILLIHPRHQFCTHWISFVVFQSHHFLFYNLKLFASFFLFYPAQVLSSVCPMPLRIIVAEPISCWLLPRWQYLLEDLLFLFCIYLIFPNLFVFFCLLLLNNWVLMFLLWFFIL